MPCSAATQCSSLLPCTAHPHCLAAPLCPPVPSTDSICVRLASLDNMLPGSGFAIHSHMFRWHKPIVARTRGLLGTKQCRVQ